jgi:hypothetical protein
MLVKGENTINAPALTGNYIFKMENHNGEKREEKILVK